ncbi:hypothetical protein FRC17_000541 [Serendipita sp. 399]|nr:hypothetical protein FRC17_000541 [Serendipita sp. 399]
MDKIFGQRKGKKGQKQIVRPTWTNNSYEIGSSSPAGSEDPNRAGFHLGTTSWVAVMELYQWPTNWLRSSKTYDNARDLVEQFLALIKELSEATELLSPLKSACALVIRGIEAIKSSEHNLVAWADICDDLVSHLSHMENHQINLQSSTNPEDKATLEALESYLRVAKDVVEMATSTFEESKLGPVSIIRRTGSAQQEKEDISRQRGKLSIAWQLYNSAMNIAFSMKIGRIEENLKDIEEHIEMKPVMRVNDDYGMTGSDSVLAYGDRVNQCEEGTRIEILESIGKWSDDSQSQSQIFWLNDAAGTGKSTVAATMASRWSLNNRLAGRFFFSPNARTTRTTRDFCRIVAEDIARNQPLVADFIQNAIKTVSSEQNIWFDVQLQRLIIEPIRQHEGDGKVFLVVDALDNCELTEERSALLNAIIRHLPSAPRLKILLTSRPIQDIVDILSISSLVHGSDIQLLNIRDSHHPDVTLFVERKLKHIPSDDRAMIIARSGGLFLYAATVCRMLERSRNPFDILKIVSEVGATDKLEHRMDILYLSVLKQALVDRGAGDMMLSVLSMIIVAYQPLSSNTIRRFLPKNDYVEEFVQDLGGVLKDGHPDRPIKVLHPTFREFMLSNEDRANGFLLHPGRSALEMANACISILEQMLEDDMFHLDRPGRLPPRNDEIENLEQLIQKSMTAAERYASAFWAHHVAASEMIPDLWSRVMVFLSKKYLNWVELISLRGVVELGVEGLSQLRRAAHRHFRRDENQIGASIRHAHQFLIHHQTLIIESAFQAYAMALFFTPPESPLFGEHRKRYQHCLPKIMTPSHVEWDEHIMLSGHSARIEQLLFSPDSSRLISIDVSGLLQLWNTETGSLVGRPFQGVPLLKKSGINCMFSVDGTRFGFTSWPELAQIRYSVSGELIREFNLSYGRTAALPPSMSYLLLSEGDGIQCWNMLHDQEMKTIPVKEDGFSFAGQGIFVSPDEKMAVISGGVGWGPKRLIRIFLWDINTPRRIRSIPTTHFGYGSLEIVFSPDGSRFSIWSSSSEKAQLYDGHNGDDIELIETPKNIQFCPMSRYLMHISPLSPGIIIREAKFGGQISTILCTKRPKYLSFSLDGTRIACVDGNQAVRVWNVETCEPLESIFPGYTGNFRCCSLSANWNHFVLASSNFQTRIYNLQLGAAGRVTPESNLSAYVIGRRRILYAILGVAYVGSLVAIRSHVAEEVGLWDPVTGTKKEGISMKDPVVSVAFSPDGREIAILLETSVVSIHNASTWEHLDSLQVTLFARGMDGGVLYSSDSSLLGAYHRGYIEVWETSNLTSILSSDTDYEIREDDPVNLCAFSSDNMRLVGVGGGDQLYVWNLQTNTTLRRTIDRYDLGDTKLSASFSPTDSSLLAVVLMLRGLTLWKVGEELQVIIGIPLPGKDYIQPAFSPDGLYFSCNPYCWSLQSPSKPVLYNEVLPPPSFSSLGLRAHSFLYYKDGWICSTFPNGPLVPLPTEHRLLNLNTGWYAFGERVIFTDAAHAPKVPTIHSVETVQRIVYAKEKTIMVVKMEIRLSNSSSFKLKVSYTGFKVLKIEFFSR